MSQQLSFTKIENELLPKFRKMTNQAESTEDVKKFFCYCTQELLNQAFGGSLKIDYHDLGLEPGKEPPYFIGEKIRSQAGFAEIWNASDLRQIVGRFAEFSLNHYRHREKMPEKTASKIRM